MSPYKRGMIFTTFLGSCLCIGLLAAALGTEYWLIASGKRTPEKPDDVTNRSNGKIHFGLFEGQKELDVGYGCRINRLDITALLQKEPDFMIYSLWLGTKYCMYFALIFSVASAVSAVVNTATTPAGYIMGIPGLYAWNIISILLQIFATSFWAAQYYTKLRYNVMTAEDRNLHWTSNGMAFYGHSFWIAIGSIAIQAINVILIFYGTSELRRWKSKAPVLEEKTNGAIMLY